MKKKYEAPEVEMINFEVRENLMSDSGGLDPEFSDFDQGVEDW